MRKYSNMIIRLFLQYNNIEKESNYRLNFNNYFMLEENKRICNIRLFECDIHFWLSRIYMVMCEIKRFTTKAIISLRALRLNV